MFIKKMILPVLDRKSHVSTPVIDVVPGYLGKARRGREVLYLLKEPRVEVHGESMTRLLLPVSLKFLDGSLGVLPSYLSYMFWTSQGTIPAEPAHSTILSYCLTITASNLIWPYPSRLCTCNHIYNNREPYGT